MAFYAFRFPPGDRILTGRAEYASNWIALQQVADAHRRGGRGRAGRRARAVRRRRARGDARRAASSSSRSCTRRRTAGSINPAAEVGRLTRAAGVPLLLDACQSVGQLPVDVEALGCDILSATGRKFLRGPRGTGFLWVRREPDRGARAAVPRPARRRVAAGRRLSRSATTHAASRTGRRTTPARSASAWPPTTRWRSGSTRSRERVQALAARLRARARRARRVEVHDRGARARRARSPSPSPGRHGRRGARRRSPPSASTSRSCTASYARLQLDDARRAAARPRLGALLQHRGGARPARRGRRCL